MKCISFFRGRPPCLGQDQADVIFKYSFTKVLVHPSCCNWYIRESDWFGEAKDQGFPRKNSNFKQNTHELIFIRWVMFSDFNPSTSRACNTEILFSRTPSPLHNKETAAHSTAAEQPLCDTQTKLHIATRRVDLLCFFRGWALGARSSQTCVFYCLHKLFCKLK